MKLYICEQSISVLQALDIYCNILYNVILYYCNIIILYYNIAIIILLYCEYIAIL